MLWVVPAMIYFIGGISGNAAYSNFKIFTTNSGRDLLGFFMFLKNSSLLDLEQLVDVYAKDLVIDKYRFILLYSLLSPLVALRLFIQIKLTEFVFTSSISSIYLSAEWSERELWDMFGVFSLGNYDMRRLLTDYSFTGFPLRKTFPMTGFFEIFYEDFFQHIVVERISLRQAYRTFFYMKNTKIAITKTYTNVVFLYLDDFCTGLVDNVFFCYNNIVNSTVVV